MSVEEPTVTAFPIRAIIVTPSDANNLQDHAGTDQAMQVQAVSAGNVAVLPLGNPDGQTLVFSLAAGEYVPVRCIQVLSTNTTAATIRGYW
jgi:hypothetical protein